MFKGYQLVTFELFTLGEHEADKDSFALTYRFRNKKSPN